MNVFKPVLILGAMGALAGCSTNQTYLTANTGDALRAGLAKQIIDPDAAKGAPEATTEKAAAAIARYRNDEVKDPSPEELGFIITE